MHISFISGWSFALVTTETSQIIFERVQIWINPALKTSKLTVIVLVSKSSVTDWVTSILRPLVPPIKSVAKITLFHSHAHYKKTSQHPKLSSTLYLSLYQQRCFTRFASFEGLYTIVRTQQITWKLSIGLTPRLQTRRAWWRMRQGQNFGRRQQRFSVTEIFSGKQKTGTKVWR